jgi:hypothetical protein
MAQRKNFQLFLCAIFLAPGLACAASLSKQDENNTNTTPTQDQHNLQNTPKGREKGTF